MKNFIAFRFCDNDFHNALRQAVQFLADNDDFSNYPTGALKHAVGNATVAFSILQSVSYGREYSDHSKYIFENLEVLTVDKLSELENNGEGYVVNTHTLNVSYYGY